jgi:hypothetical protein
MASYQPARNRTRCERLGRLARSVMSSGVTLGAGSASPQAKPALPGSCGPVVPAFSDGIQMMNSAIAANWHVAAAQT